MSDLPTNLAHLSPDARRDLLARMLAARTNKAEPIAPCSQGQRSLWFMHQLAPESAVYNVAMGWRLRSTVDVAAMQRAFQALVDRHEALRTTYESKDGEPWQRVHQTLIAGFEARDVGPIDETELRALLTADAAQPFDLERGPILRARLFSRHATDHALLLAMHHIACDLWSIELLLNDLRVLYEREVGGSREPSVPQPAPGRYRDFVEWQRSMISGPDGDAHWKYWSEKLGGTIPRVDLPSDRPRPPVQSFAGSGVRFVVPPVLVDDLRALATAEGTTLFTVFLTAFQSLVVRYSGQTDVLVGSPATGRSRGEFEKTVGYFVNPIVFRCDASDDPTFRQLLSRTRKDVLGALDHQDYPFPLIVEKLHVGRDVSRSPLADVYFVWDKMREPTDRPDRGAVQSSSEMGPGRIDWDDLSLEAFTLTQVGTPSDIAVLVWDMGQTISVNLGFSTDLFDRATVERMGEHFLMLLRGVAVDASSRISALPIATADEVKALSRVSSTVLVKPPTDVASTLHGRFEAQARRRPDAVAVTGANGRLTYANLDARANHLAARLRAAGVRRGSVVGLYIERDVELAVAVLGILKAGGAYLPIDGTYPDERAAFMLADSGAEILVTQRALASALPTVASVTRIFSDDSETSTTNASETTDAQSIAASSVEGSTFESSADDLAYVIYTSGSTGRPKGVMVTHRNVMRLFDSTDHWFAFDERDVWSLFHSIAFDFSVWEFWGALLTGARVLIVPYATTRSPDDLLEMLSTERVTILSQTPSAFRQLISADSARIVITPLALRLVIFGGEALDVNMLRPWFERRGDSSPRLVNMYGITETTVHTTYRAITRADLNARVRSPIGVPIPDLHLLVLDAAGKPVPVGVPGELYVGGAGVARGYLNRAELTAARFLPDPTSDDPNARLYRSGDLVRRLADGDIEYLGRIDHQVKVRGFRIELGEIESALAQHADVSNCVVLVRDDASGEARVVAYVVPRSAEAASNAELQAFLRRSLPEYMVPTAFIRLSALPLTSNHKLDVKALPVPEQVESTSTRTFVAPGTTVEREMAAEWARMLSVDRVGLDDDFFELGGHSILATGLARWIRDHFRVDFPVYAVFESPTVAGMARRVVELEALRADVSVRAPALATAPREEFDL